MDEEKKLPDDKDWQDQRWKPDPLSVLMTKVSSIERSIETIQKQQVDNFVTRDAFTPVRNIVYGMVAVILMSVLSAIVYLVVNAPKPR